RVQRPLLFVDVLLFSFQGSVCCRRFIYVVRCCLATFTILKHVYIPVNTFSKVFLETLLFLLYSSFLNLFQPRSSLQPPAFSSHLAVFLTNIKTIHPLE
ncbi:hypothetical protein, partial [Planococcus sp. ISL-110]|uniref:hypothetical protein n=1 Tax=Planococcus sp. ISL-110 TaxID=2819167 RepID=UPI001BE701A5